MSAVAQRLAPFGTTVFARISAQAAARGAVNLGQGFPDFDGPDFVKEAAKRAVDEGCNQYCPIQGVPELRRAIAAFFATGGPQQRLELDADEEITVTPGCTGAIAAATLGLVNPGEEVVLFEPYYDSYRACCAMAGATPRFVTLHGPDFTFDPDELRAAVTPRTRAILVNTPHNPTGRVFTREELQTIADVCLERDLIALSDEVYERLVFEGEHLRLAALPGMRERTLTLSSLGKTFSLTGWKIGWAAGPAPLVAGVRAANQFL
ncbi:MAG: aminotransferase class I/II-fold pyridoxal phosphate-dependent enzyme, partial [Planctomycetota bacterium]